MRNLKQIIAVIVIICSSNILFSQNYHEIQKQFSFKHITIDNGLSNNGITGICQDKLGYMWFATLNGLNKYNGIENIKYIHENKDQLSIISNWVNTVYSDSEGNIWAGTEIGICRYDEVENNFVAFYNDIIPESVGNVYEFVEDSLKNLWIGTSNGLYAYNLITKKSVKLNKIVIDSTKIPSGAIDNLMLEGDKIWISFFRNAIGLYNIKTNNLRIFYSGKDYAGKIPDLRIEILFRDKLGYTWIGSYNNGIELFNPIDSSFQHLQVNKDDIYTTRVRAFFEDTKGNLFAGTRGGLYIYDRYKNQFNLYADVKHKFSTLSNNSVLCSYIDQCGGLWLGTRYGGVNYSNLEQKPFVHFSARENDNRFLNHSSVFAFAEDSKGTLYVATENGLNIFDPKTYTFSYKTSEDKDYPLSYNDIKALACDKNDNIWIGSNNGGLDYYNSSTKSVKHFRNNPKHIESLWSDKVYYLLNDKNNDLWVISNPDRENYPSTLSCLKNGQNSFIHFRNDFYGGLYEKADDNLLIGGKEGFYIYNRKNNQFLFKRNDTLIRNTLCIYEDFKGNIWIGSNYGLTRYDIKNESFKQYSLTTGYPIYEVYGILSDDEYNLWISTSDGLIKLIDVIVNPESMEYKVYTKNDGLQSKQFIPNAYFKSKEGEMYFGGINGYNSFLPDKIRDSRYSPEIHFSSLRIGNKNIMPGEKVSGKVMINDIISRAAKITIAPNVQTITLTFDALHYTNPQENKYEYMLVGFDNDWTNANAYNNSITYTDLPAGNYDLIVYALNSDGIQSLNPAEIKIEVLPHYWNTALFKILMAILVLVIGTTIYKLRVYNLRNQKKKLAVKVKEKTKELEDSYYKLQERQNEILAQNEEIQTQNEEIFQQNEEIVAQRDEIKRKSDELEEAFNKTKLLNDFGKKITSTLNIEAVNDMIYKYLTSLMDTSIFGIGIYDEKKNGLVFSSLMESGKPIDEFISTLDDTTSLGAYCFNNQEVVACSDFEKEFSQYISEIKVRSSSTPKSLMYAPLTVNKKRIGVFTVQSYYYNAYSVQDFFTFESLASFIAIALDNSWAYNQLRSQNEEIEKHRTNLSKLVYDRTKELEKAKVKAEESDRLKSAFLANLSHEIRTPLNAIIGFIEVVSNETISEKEKINLYPLIQNSGFYLSNLINDIIDFSKIEANQIEIRSEVVMIEPVLKDIFHFFSEEIIRLNKSIDQSVSLRYSGIDCSQLAIYTDIIRFKQIMNNLIGNAIKFTTKGEIEFGVTSFDQSYVTFFVKDTGIGIDKKNFDIIFERFRKIEDNIETIYRGTGLGLAITKYLLVRMGGDIWVESKLGSGSQFFFKLPVSKSEIKVPANVNSFYDTLKSPDWKNKNVLVVEDEQSNFMLLESMLKKTNINIYWAKNGEEAVKMFKTNNSVIDLILMDIKLPVKNGIEAAKEIKEFKNSVPIIAQTAHALPHEEYEIRNSGFDEYITKPIVKSKLFDIMSGFIQ